MYRLKGKRVVPVRRLLDWSHAFESKERFLFESAVGDQRVTTIFIGIDALHGLSVTPPRLFETGVFDGKRWFTVARYATWKRAKKGHNRTVYFVRTREARGYV